MYGNETGDSELETASERDIGKDGWDFMGVDDEDEAVEGHGGKVRSEIFYRFNCIIMINTLNNEYNKVLEFVVKKMKR